jgi:uncharacterized protein involved in outer membrane biogenesis
LALTIWSSSGQRLHLFPVVGVRASNILVKNPEGLPAGDTIAVKSVEIGVEPRALLSRRLEVTQVTVDGVRIQMLRGSVGRTHFDAPRRTSARASRSGRRVQFITFDRVT